MPLAAAPPQHSAKREGPVQLAGIHPAKAQAPRHPAHLRHRLLAQGSKRLRVAAGDGPLGP